MHARYWRHMGLTTGERRLVLAFVAVSLFGAMLAFCAFMRLSYGAMMPVTFSTYETWICISGAIGAGSGLFLARGRFGHAGPTGLRQAAFGMGITSFAGSLIAGTLALPLYGTMFGPFTLAVILIGTPFLGLLWLITLLGVHLLMLQWKAERDSIFTAASAQPGFSRIADFILRP